MRNRQRSPGMFFICMLSFLWMPCFSARATDPGDSVIIRKIIIAGNKKTRHYIIFRELPFRQGDTLCVKDVAKLLATAQKNLYNTELFIAVDVYDKKITDEYLDIYIEVKERWYTFPVPYVELADRSFNIWWQKYHADLKRLSYGIDLWQQNLTGRNDNLEILATAGFTRQLHINYKTPNLTTGMQTRMQFGVSVLGSKGIPYISNDSNRLLYYLSESTIQRDWRADAGFILRKGIKKRESLTLSIEGLNLFDSIQIINPNFLYSQKSRVIFPELRYKLQYDDADNILYPLKGSKYGLTLSKRGIGWTGDVNRLFASASAEYFEPLGKDWFAAMQVQAQMMLPFDQPFYNTNALGYGSHFVRGFELYVVDGVASFVAKADLKKKLLHLSVPTFLNSKNYHHIPFTFYGKVFADAGAAYNRRESILGNKLIYGGGIGLDIVTLYDLAVSINFSLNSLNQTGVFLHRQ